MTQLSTWDITLTFLHDKTTFQARYELSNKKKHEIIKIAEEMAEQRGFEMNESYIITLNCIAENIRTHE